MKAGRDRLRAGVRGDGDCAIIRHSPGRISECRRAERHARERLTRGRRPDREERCAGHTEIVRPARNRCRGHGRDGFIKLRQCIKCSRRRGAGRNTMVGRGRGRARREPRIDVRKRV